jgi:hypothetical protein
VERWLLEADDVPKAVDFPSGVECWTQVVHMAKIRYLLQGAAEEAAGP